MNRILIAVLTFMISSLLTQNAYSQYCPTKIAAVDGNDLSNGAIPILKQIYANLGCSPDIIFLPGRRGVRHFNLSLVDGELFRFRFIEENYKKEFVRSSIPMLRLVSALWQHPSPKIAKTKPMAFVLGIAWQEKFISETPIRNSIKFHADQQVIDAYNNGAIGSFLARKPAISIFLKKQALQPVPVLKKTISSMHLYHYLDIKYANFMADFSEELRLKNQFSKLE